MSLDIYLYNNKTITCECGKVHEVETDNCVFDANITHNLGTMAEKAGIYKLLWESETIGVSKAGQMIKPLRVAIHKMLNDPKQYTSLDAENGWGTYYDFMPWLGKLLEACIDYPEASIKISK